MRSVGVTFINIRFAAVAGNCSETKGNFMDFVQLRRVRIEK